MSGVPDKGKGSGGKDGDKKKPKRELTEEQRRRNNEVNTRRRRAVKGVFRTQEPGGSTSTFVAAPQPTQAASVDHTFTVSDQDSMRTVIHTAQGADPQHTVPQAMYQKSTDKVRQGLRLADPAHRQNKPRKPKASSKSLVPDAPKGPPRSQPQANARQGLQPTTFQHHVPPTQLSQHPPTEPGSQWIQEYSTHPTQERTSRHASPHGSPPPFGTVNADNQRTLDLGRHNERRQSPALEPLSRRGTDPRSDPSTAVTRTFGNLGLTSSAPPLSQQQRPRQRTPTGSSGDLTHSPPFGSDDNPPRKQQNTAGTGKKETPRVTMRSLLDHTPSPPSMN